MGLLEILQRHRALGNDVGGGAMSMPLSGDMSPRNPFLDWMDQNKGKITGAFGGMVGAGNDPRQALMGWSQGLQHGKSVDDENAILRQQEAEKKAAFQQTQQEQNQTRAWIQANFPQYANLPLAQAMEMATSAEPYTLGEGQTRFDVNNKPIAAGAPSTPDTLVTTNIGGTDKFYDKIDEKMAEQTAAMIDTGLNAQSNNIRLGQIEELLKTAPQGAQGVLTQAAGAIGIPLEGASEVQAAQALINQMVPGQRPPGSGTMSDADLALFKASLPAIINQPGGNALIIQTAKSINDYYVSLATIAQQVANREISPAEGRKAQAAVPNPLAGFKPTGGGQVTRFKFNPATGELE